MSGSDGMNETPGSPSDSGTAAPLEVEADQLDRRAASIALRCLARGRGLRFAVEREPERPGESPAAWRLEATSPETGARWIIRDRRLYDATCELALRVAAGDADRA